MVPSAGSASSLSQYRQDSPRTEEPGDSFPGLVITPSRATPSFGRNEARVHYRDNGQYDYPRILSHSNQITTLYTRSIVQNNVTPSASNRTSTNQTMSPSEQQQQSASSSSSTLKEYYDKHLNLRGTHNSPREKVSKKAPVIAELRTNIKLSDSSACALASTLSLRLKKLYSRGEESIVVTIIPSPILLLGGSTWPAWILIMTALHCEHNATMNKSRVKHIGEAVNSFLRVEPSRGIIRFQSIDEANLSQGYTTMLTQVEDLEKDQAFKESSSTGSAAGIIKRAFTRNRAGPASSTPKDENEPPPQTPTRPPVTSSAPSDDSVDPSSPLNKNENTTRWPTPPKQHLGDAAQDDNPQTKVSFEGEDSSKSGNSTQPIVEGAKGKEPKRIKSLFDLLRNKK
ncbi:MAG: hypothetical protein Q9157_004258 [Trypethelium eluteriae]